MPRRKCRQTSSAPPALPRRAKCLYGDKGDQRPQKSDPGGHLTSSCRGDASLEAFDIKCSYVMTLTRWNYCLCSLGVCFFILFSVTSGKRILKHSNGGLATITMGSWWGLIPFDINILGRVWKSMNLQDSETDTQTQHSFEGTKLESYW